MQNAVAFFNDLLTVSIALIHSACLRVLLLLIIQNKGFEFKICLKPEVHFKTWN